MPVRGNVPLAAAYIKLFAERKGLRDSYNIEILRAGQGNTFGDRALVAAIAERDPWLVGFTCYLWNIERTLWIARELKRQRPDVPTADTVIEAFRHPHELPKPLAMIFVKARCNVPCRKWSYLNQLIMHWHGHDDARGFRQWLNVGRQVKKGERAFYILSPCMKKVTNEDTGEDRTFIYGFRGTAVFGLNQTEGDELPPEVNGVDDTFLNGLPFIEVAKEWNLEVTAKETNDTSVGGMYVFGEHKRIELYAENMDIWAHELMHAADDRNGTLKGLHSDAEVVAQLGAATLLEIAGKKQENDLGETWRYIQRYAARDNLEVIDACQKVLKRTCKAIALIIETAEHLARMEVARC